MPYRLLDILSSMLVVATSGTGFVLGSGNIIDFGGLFWTCAGTMMVAASANSLNQVSFELLIIIIIIFQSQSFSYYKYCLCVCARACACVHVLGCLNFQTNLCILYCQVFEINNDAKMKRTMRRPLPSGRLSIHHAVTWASSVGVAGTAILACKVVP